VMTTSESHVSKVSEAMSAGANNYLVKPCDPPKLRQRLERALMRSMV
jgi:PleD family two-component response regulator